MKFCLVSGWHGVIYGDFWLTEKKVNEIGKHRQFEIVEEVEVPDGWSPKLVQAAIEKAEIQFYDGRI